MNGLEGRDIARRLGLAAAALAVGALLIGVVVVFLALAAFLALSERLAPWQAALIVAGCALPLAALLIYLALRSIERTGGEAAEAVSQAVKSSAVVTFAPMAMRLLTRNARLATGVAAVGGALLALLRALRPERGPEA
jgi:hypothetical protein